MHVSKVFAALTQDGIPFVLIGGAALTAYGSTRVSLDTDIAIKAVDVDREQYPVIARTADEAQAFLRHSRQGFMKFLSRELELDFVYDNPVPFMRLRAMGQEVELDGVRVRLASLEHLKIMKELSVRTRDDEDKVKTDRLDLEFIGRKLGEAKR